MMTIELVGWIGNIMLAVCGLPQAYQCWKDKNAKQVNLFFLLLWLFGELFSLTFVFLSLGLVKQLIFNYSVNLISLFIIFYYKFFGKNVLGEKL